MFENSVEILEVDLASELEGVFANQGDVGSVDQLEFLGRACAHGEGRKQDEIEESELLCLVRGND